MTKHNEKTLGALTKLFKSADELVIEYRLMGQSLEAECIEQDIATIKDVHDCGCCKKCGNAYEKHWRLKYMVGEYCEDCSARELKDSCWDDTEYQQRERMGHQAEAIYLKK